MSALSPAARKVRHWALASAWALACGDAEATPLDGALVAGVGVGVGVAPLSTLLVVDRPLVVVAADTSGTPILPPDVDRVMGTETIWPVSLSW